MKMVADAGAWVIGPPVAEIPALAVLEVSGAVMEWTVDDPGGAAATRMTVTDVVVADWLWRIVGPSGHAAVVAALTADDGVQQVDLTRFELLPQALEPLRRLAIGYWLRRWWPESVRDGIVPLDRALLDGELAVLTNAAQEFFTEDTLDFDVEGLLAPHQLALLELEHGGDPRVAQLVRRCAELADDVGVWSPEVSVVPGTSFAGRRGDYALAAGRAGGTGSGAIAAGVGSVDWITVPAGTFDAAEGTIDWSVESADAAVFATVHVATTSRAPDAASARGVGVRLRSGSVTGTGVLDANGTAALSLVGEAGRELTEIRAWDHDWSVTHVELGGATRPAVDPAAAAALRQRIRDFARTRLARPGPNAFLAEILAAESDY
jgi:hypothetical protein